MSEGVVDGGIQHTDRGFIWRNGILASMRDQLEILFENDRLYHLQPHRLQQRAFFLMFALVCMTFFASQLHALLWQSSEWLRTAILPAVIVDLTNDERSEQSLGVLRRNALLDQAATMKARHMASESYFSHYSPSGVSPWYWFSEAGYHFVHAGENLAIHFSDSGQVVAAWMNSPLHRDNILNRKYQEIGVGTAKGVYQGYETVYVVQLFGAPALTPEEASAQVPDTVLPVYEPAVVLEEIISPATVAGIEQGTDLTSQIEMVPTSTEIVNSPITSTTPSETTVFEENAEGENSEEAGIAEVMQKEKLANGQNSEEIAQVTFTDNGVSVFSSHISTSTDNIPLIIGVTEVSGSSVSKILVAATQPQRMLQLGYTLLALLVVGMLVRAMLLEMRQHRPVQIAYSVLLIAVMAGLWSLHIYLTNGAVVI